MTRERTGSLIGGAVFKTRPTPHPGIVPGLAHGPDGNWLVTGNYGDDRPRIWDAATGQIRQEIRGPTGTFRLVRASPGGERVAATGYDGQRHRLRISSTVSGERLYSAAGKALAYSPDGCWLAALAGDDKTLFLLDARAHETAARLTVPPGHEGAVPRAAFSDLRQGIQGHLTQRRKAAKNTWRFFLVFLCVFAPLREVLFFHPPIEVEVRLQPGQQPRVQGVLVKLRYQARREGATLRPRAQHVVEQLGRQ